MKTKHIVELVVLGLVLSILGYAYLMYSNTESSGQDALADDENNMIVPPDQDKIPPTPDPAIPVPENNYLVISDRQALDAEIAKAKENKLRHYILFSIDNCIHCERLKKVLKDGDRRHDAVKNQFRTIMFFELDAMKFPELRREFQIDVYPYSIFNGQEKRGFLSRDQLNEWLSTSRVKSNILD